MSDRYWVGKFGTMFASAKTLEEARAIVKRELRCERVFVVIADMVTGLEVR